MNKAGARSTEREARLVAALVRLQEEKGWTDKYVAERLGVTRALWNLVRRDVQPLRYKVLTGILNGFGRELASEAFFFVASGVTEGDNNGEPPAHGEGQHGKRRPRRVRQEAAS